jgi:hypothetical protein
MPPRKAAATPPPPALRTALEVDLARLNLTDRHALVDLARKLADHLDAPPRSCPECGGHAGPDAPTVLRYADALEALGIGSIPPAPPEDGFTRLVREFNAARP